MAVKTRWIGKNHIEIDWEDPLTPVSAVERLEMSFVLIGIPHLLIFWFWFVFRFNLGSGNSNTPGKQH